MTLITTKMNGTNSEEEIRRAFKVGAGLHLRFHGGVEIVEDELEADAATKS